MPKQKKNKSLKAAIYIRVSTTEQSDNEFSSLDGQLSQCKTWIQQKNTMGGIEGRKISDFEVYKDAKSGKDLNRPGIERLLKDAQNDKFDLLIVTKLDRVSRSLQDFLNLFQKLEESNVDIAVVTQDIDTSSPAGKALQRMLLVFAEFERDMVSDRTREKRIESLKAGLWTGGYQILGYDLEDKKLIKNETEAELVKTIYQKYLELKSANKVARYLNKTGYRNKKWITQKGTPRGGGKFNKKNVLSILKRQLYTGFFEIGGSVYEGQHEPVVDQSLFDQTQQLIHQNSVTPHANTSSDTPAVLKGICSCGLCENSMTVYGTKNRHKSKYYYYKCTNKNNNGVTADHNPKDLPVGTLDNFVFRTIKILLKEPELLNAMKKRTKYEGEDRINEIKNRIKQLQVALKEQKKRKTNTLQLITDNPSDIIKEAYESQLKTVILEIQESEDQINFYTDQLESLKQKSPVSKNSYKSILKDFTQNYENSDTEIKRNLTQILVKEVNSHVNQNTNDGFINVQYIADKRLEAEWQDIKKGANSIKVRTFGTSGSPGRI